MRSQGFRSVFMVASCAAAALGCYLVSLRVASERAALDQVETRIVVAQRDIRLLQTEIGTRGRLSQLERWNVRVLALSAPSADQFLEGGFALARLARPQRQPDIEAPVVLASAPAEVAKPQLDQEGEETRKPAAPAQLMHQASVKLPARDSVTRAASEPAPPLAAEKRKDVPPVASAKAEPPAAAPKQQQGGQEMASSKPRAIEAQPATAPKKAGDNKAAAASASVTKPVRTASVDPLAPLPDGAGSSKPAKEPGPAR